MTTLVERSRGVCYFELGIQAHFGGNENTRRVRYLVCYFVSGIQAQIRGNETRVDRSRPSYQEI